MTTETAALTWDDVLGRKDLIGGDIESVEEGVVYRGPLGGIEVDGNSIEFKSPWVARKDKSGVWENWYITSSSINKKSQPQDIGNGRIHFLMPPIGTGTLFPKGDSKLDSCKVRGLAPAWQRLLALYPGLRLDREKAMAVFTEYKFDRQKIDALSGLPTNANLGDLLALFRTEDTKEVFLWLYIEAVTGEIDVNQKVY